VKGVFRELQHFISSHERCAPSGVAVDAAAAPGADGYELCASCGCGASFQRWVSPEDARYDMIFTTLLLSSN